MEINSTIEETKPQDPTILEIRNVIARLHNDKIYKILSVIRGPDSSEDQWAKPITAAIRSYVGFNVDNCGGWIMLQQADFDELKVSLYTLENSTSTSHYLFHLRDAVKVIGKDNLIEFVKERFSSTTTVEVAATMEFEDEDEFDEDEDDS